MFATSRIVFVSLLWVAGTSVSAQIGVSPSRFELDMGATPTTETIRLFNFGDEPADVRVSVHNFDLDETNDVRILPPDEQSLDRWLVINPLHFTVPPGESQVVRFSPRPRVRPGTGEHRAMIFFEEAGAPKIIDGYDVVFRLGVAVYGYVGEVTRVAALEGIHVDRSAAVLEIASRGTGHVRLQGTYAVWPAGSGPGDAGIAMLSAFDEDPEQYPDGVVVAGKLPTTPVLPGASRRCRLPFGASLPPGDYVLEMYGMLAGEALSRRVPFSVGSEENIARAPAE